MLEEIPLVMATDKLDEFLPGLYLNHSVIKVQNFATPLLLAEYLKYLSNNETEYNKYLEWKCQNIQLIAKSVLLHHASTGGCVPVFMATNKLDEFLFTNVSDFGTPQLLGEYLKYLSNNETEYNIFLE